MAEIKRSLAVVIGINQYVNGIPELKTAVNDAVEIAHILETKYQYQVLRLLDEEATGTHLKELFAAFEQQTLPLSDRGAVATLEASGTTIQLHPDDRLLFYFAGHGIALDALSNADGPVGFLVPQDARMDNDSSLLSMKRLHDALLALPCRHLLIILDCCFAGAFRWAGQREAVRSQKMYRERYERFISGCAQQVITSAADDEKAADSLYGFGQRSENSKNSPFAQFLLKGLSGAADFTGDGVITATELYVYIHGELGKTSAKQTPGFCQLKRHDKGEYIFPIPSFEPNQLDKAPLLDEKANPYKGLESFEENDSDKFFGRKALTEKLQEFLTINPLTVVLGASGSGKSSLVKAGLIPMLKKNKDSWRILPPIRPGESPFHALNKALERENLPVFAIPSQVSNSSDNSQWYEKGLQNLSLDLTAWRNLHPNSKLLLVIDQSEEVVTLCQSDTEREMFLSGLARALKAFPDWLRIVLTLRSDFEPQVRETALEPYWSEARFIVPAMTREELRAAIVEPASAKVMYFEPPTLVEQLIDEVVQMPGALPLLSFTLSELYLKYIKSVREGKRNNRAITQQDYEELGGVARSLTQRADWEYDELVKVDPAYKQTLRHVMLRMVALSGSELARRQVDLSELEYPEPKNERVKLAIERFATARLLVKGRDIKGNLYVEPAHDALVRGWQKLRTWKDRELASLLLQRELTAIANKWANSKGDKKAVGLLWDNDPRLPLVRQVLESDDNWLNSLESEFVQHSIQRRRNNRRRLIGSVTAVTLGLTGLSIFALIQMVQSQLKAIDAIVASSDTHISSNQGWDALIESINAVELLRQSVWVKTDTKVKVATALSQAVYGIRESNRLEGHKNWVTAVTFSPDGQMLASASADNTIKLWKRSGSKIRTLHAHTDQVFVVTFSPNGKRLASAGKDKTVKLWNLDGKLLRTLKHTQAVIDVSFSPDGQTLASACKDNMVRLWNLDGKLLQTFKGHTNSVQSVNFSPDGQTIASASSDKTVRLWNLDGKLLRTFKGHTNSVQSVNFSPDGQTLASAGDDNTVRLWNLDGKLLRTLLGHTELVRTAYFSPNGKTIVSASRDQTVKLWSLGGNLLQTFQGHTNEVTAARISPDGKTIASSSKDWTVKLWSVEGESPIIFREHTNTIKSIRFSSNGKLLASSSMDGNIKVWTPQRKVVQNIQGHQKGHISVSFSPDSQFIVSASHDGTIKLWSVNGKLPKTFQGHQDLFMSANFSLDGKMIVSASYHDDSGQGKIKLWNLDGTLVRTIKGDEQEFFPDASFSPDGQIIASASDNGNIKLWSLDGILLKTIPAHAVAVRRVSFSPDGQIIASASEDGTVKLWRRDGTQISEPIKHGQRVVDLSFSPDGKTIASASLDGTINISNLDGTRLGTLKGSAEILSVSFSPNGKLIAWASFDKTVTLWNLDLDNLLVRGCNWLHSYLKTNPSLNKNLRYFCNKVDSKAEQTHRIYKF